MDDQTNEKLIGIKYRSVDCLRVLFFIMLVLFVGFSPPMQCGVFATEKSKDATEKSKDAPEKSKDAPEAKSIKVSSKMSLIHVGSNDSFKPSTEGVEAGRLLLNALESKNLKLAADAIEKYSKIIPRENYGGEYTALEWFAKCLIAPKDKRDDFLSDVFVADFYHFFCDNDYKLLKEYLIRKYQLSEIGDEKSVNGHKRLAWLEDTILFNNPRREQWEKTSAFLELINLTKGMVIADVGSGPGYYSVKFAKRIGSEGKVYAIDTVSKHLDYLERVKLKLNLENITTIHSDGRTIGIPGEKVDAVFLCSLYHNIYGMATLPERDSFLESIRSALKNEGRLYLFDNGLVPKGTLPYHGPYVAKELVIEQLKHYGFNLVEDHQPVPQRYALVFEKANPQDSQRTDNEKPH